MENFNPDVLPFTVMVFVLGVAFILLRRPLARYACHTLRAVGFDRLANLEFHVRAGVAVGVFWCLAAVVLTLALGFS